MKRKTIKSGITLLCLFGGMYFYSTHQSEKKVLSDLAFENIEALALSEEDPDENFKCYGWGDVECHGKKVEVKYGGLR
ncbi:MULTISPECIES: NVEALA domain-containing protein [Parabacteroides]|uniref:NVEALA domain-containing protein n=1 Tax=Parabacteroides leei TaxID=2939491 RepID=UPI00189A5681|nr:MULTISPECIES: NVEALA domain-containing protein [Parabacteroides]MCL3852745.1 NVEALA domain-containing protein [Parabacteroides leei]